MAVKNECIFFYDESIHFIETIQLEHYLFPFQNEHFFFLIWGNAFYYISSIATISPPILLLAFPSSFFVKLN